MSRIPFLSSPVTGLLLVGLATSMAGCAPASAPQEAASPSVGAPVATATPTPSAAASSPATPSASGSASAAHEFAYEGAHGPAHWGSLNPAWETCATGTKQSPVDLVRQKAEDLPSLSLDYAGGQMVLENTGHALQATVAQPQTLVRGGQQYKLVQFHLHTPSEHLVGSKPADGELHLVHSDAKGRLLVLGVLVTSGKSSPQAWSWLSGQLPEAPGVTRPGGQVDLRAMLPSDLAHSAYEGSLTTPPCTEGVQWVLLDEPVTLAAKDIERLEKLTGENARPVQPLNGRELEQDETP
ncbi:carbonic anhydrase [Luteococcus sediminum]